MALRSTDWTEVESCKVPQEKATGNGMMIDGLGMKQDMTDVAATAGHQPAEETAKKTAAEHSDRSAHNAAETDSDSASNFVQESDFAV